MNKPTTNPETRIALFQHKEIRRTIHNNERWFVINDVVTVLTDSVDASDYLKRLRKRDPSLGEAFQGGGTTNYLALTQSAKKAKSRRSPATQMNRARP